MLMNNYDYNFNGEMLEKNSDSKSKFILKMNNLKLLCYFLVTLNIFHIIFFMGYSVFSFVIVIYIFYISYKILFRILNEEALFYEIDQKTISNQLQALGLNIILVVFLCILDILVGIVFMDKILFGLFNSENNFENYFGILSTYLSIFRLLYLGFLYQCTKL